MSRKNVNARRRGTGEERDGLRGRHRRGTSPETLAWEREHLPPECPSWMPRDTYLALRELARGLE